jgi:hypothetical protein
MRIEQITGKDRHIFLAALAFVCSVSSASVAAPPEMPKLFLGKWCDMGEGDRKEEHWFETEMDDYKCWNSDAIIVKRSGFELDSSTCYVTSARGPFPRNEWLRVYEFSFNCIGPDDERYRMRQYWTKTKLGMITEMKK